MKKATKLAAREVSLRLLASLRLWIIVFASAAAACASAPSLAFLPSEGGGAVAASATTNAPNGREDGMAATNCIQSVVRKQLAAFNGHFMCADYEPDPDVS